MSESINENTAPATPRWQPEPELTSPTPRTLKPRIRERLSRGLFCTLTLIVPIVLSYFGYVSQRNLSAILDHGVVAVGTVVERRPPHKDSLPQLVYEYQVGDMVYRVVDGRSKGDWDAAPLGSQMPVHYLPEDPGSAYTEHGLRVAGANSPLAVGLGIVSVILFVLMGPFWLYIEIKFRRVRQLARTGMPTAAVLTDIRRFGPSNYDQWRVRYAFAGADESTREGTTYLYGSDLKKLGGVGTVATVLVDPANDKRFEFYRSVAMLYTIVPES
jgi:hypothetical protein